MNIQCLAEYADLNGTMIDITLYSDFIRNMIKTGLQIMQQ